MTALLGAILLKLREFEAAEAHLRRAIELAPTFAKPHEDLGRLLVEQGRPEEAVELLKSATRLGSRGGNGLLHVGPGVVDDGQRRTRRRRLRSLLQFKPGTPETGFGGGHHKAGRHEEAGRLYRALLAESPNNVDAMRLLAGILVGQSDVEEAEALLRKAVSLAPDYALAFLDLGVLFQEQHRYAEAIECFQRTIRLQPGAAKPRHLLASTLAPVGRTEDALDTYRQVLEQHPRHAGAWLGLGHTLKTIGRQGEAIEAYRQCIRVRPDNGETYWSLANLKTYQLTADDMGAMESALERADELSDQSAVNFLFALAKAHEDAGDFDTAWGYYQRGNAKQRMLEHYDPVQTEEANDEIIETFDAAFLHSAAGQGRTDAAPIFVLGLPRSGSTLIEQILASHSQVEGTSELPYLGRVATSLNRNRADGVNYPQAVRELRAAHFKALGGDYLQRAQAHRHTEKPRFVDKMPNNFPSIGFLHLILPNAKIIDARRYPLDCTLSCYRQLFAKGQTFVYDLMEIGEYFLEYQRLMDHWQDVLPGRVLTVQYEDLVTDFDRQLRRLLDYCELPWEDACANFHETDRPVRTASSEQVRQPIYANSIHFWRNYQAHLGELIDVLEPVLPRYAQYEAINR